MFFGVNLVLPNFCTKCLSAHPAYAACVEKKVDVAIHQQYVDKDENGAIAFHEGLRISWREYAYAVRRGQSLARLERALAQLAKSERLKNN